MWVGEVGGRAWARDEGVVAKEGGREGELGGGGLGEEEEGDS